MIVMWIVDKGSLHLFKMMVDNDWMEFRCR
jgi:hypothetical protein